MRHLSKESVLGYVQPASRSLYLEQMCLSSIAMFPEGLTTINVGNNELTSIPDLPSTTETFCCRYNGPLKTLPKLNEGLTSLYAYGTGISELPPLPSTLRILNIRHTQVRSLVDIPLSVVSILCDFNKLDDESKVYYLMRFGYPEDSTW